MARLGHKDACDSVTYEGGTCTCDWLPDDDDHDYGDGGLTADQEDGDFGDLGYY